MQVTPVLLTWDYNAVLKYHKYESFYLYCRFLQVLPASVEDEKLLVDVLRFLNKLLRKQKSDLDLDHLKWILKSLLKSVRMGLLYILRWFDWPYNCTCKYMSAELHEGVLFYKWIAYVTCKSIHCLTKGVLFKYLNALAFSHLQIQVKHLGRNAGRLNFNYL